MINSDDEPPFPIDYELPPHLIAQEPCAPRDHSRLLVARRGDQSLSHHRFFELPKLLSPGDLLILNDTRVINARLLGKRAGTGGKWEGLFLRTLEDGTWDILSHTRGHLQTGETIVIGEGTLELRLIERLPDGRWRVASSLTGSPFEILESHGDVPLPPYIRKGKAAARDTQRYQTVFACKHGAVAAPTAGLHFTPELFARLRERNINSAYVTLHVGLGTFQPIQTTDYRQHPMHEEWGTLPSEAVDAIARCKATGGRVIAVGTTAVRVLESAARSQPLSPDRRGETENMLEPWSGMTKLFIYPPYRFQAVDALITNFHFPRTTLLLLVAAFAGQELTRKVYETAVAESYRFYSYGDAMLVL